MITLKNSNIIYYETVCNDILKLYNSISSHRKEDIYDCYKNGNINTVTNGEIKGDVLIKNKKIEKIAESIDTTCLEDVEVIDADGLNVFPGFIDAHTHLGLWEDGLGFEGADGNEETDPITPNLNQ